MQVKFYPQEKEGGSLRYGEGGRGGGHTQFLGSFYMVA